MLNQFSRTQLLFGPEAMNKLSQCSVAVFGIGGVGGYAVEALARSGIGMLDLIDDDRVCLTNLNRQLHATRKTVGKYKVDVAEERVHEINPDCRVNTYKTFYMPDTREQFDFAQYDYVIDAIDTVTGKLSLIEAAKAAGTHIICCMGAGNKTDPTAFRVADIPVRPLEDPAISCRSHCICPPGTRKCTVRRDIPGSTAFVPSVAGLIIAAEVIKDLAGYRKDERNSF